MHTYSTEAQSEHSDATHMPNRLCVCVVYVNDERNSEERKKNRKIPRNDQLFLFVLCE